MPRYYFHTHDSVEHLDCEGTVLRGPGKARSEALMVVGELLKERGMEGASATELRVWVTDETGAIVCDFRFSGTYGPSHSA